MIGEYFQDDQWPAGWNHGYSVSNPHFVLMYVKYVIPFWDETALPQEIRLFVRAHHSVINAHQDWLTHVRANWLLSL
jgi:hypothetical protein